MKPAHDKIAAGLEDTIPQGETTTRERVARALSTEANGDAVSRLNWTAWLPAADAAIAAMPTDGWKLIETAPRDGTRVLLYVPTYEYGDPVRLGAYAESERWWRTTGGPCHDDALPTHWHPLPPPPANPSSTSEDTDHA